MCSELNEEVSDVLGMVGGEGVPGEIWSAVVGFGKRIRDM
jgi:hypothetical protein